MEAPNIGKNYDKYIPRVSMGISYNKRCRYPGCGVEPIYNYPIHKTGVYCKTHKLDGMEDVKNNKCHYKIGGDKLCTTRANYNYPGHSKGAYCARHQLPGMMNVVYTLCPVKGCGRIPQFNFAGEKVGKYCSKHAEPGMRNIKKKTMQELLTELEEKIMRSRCKMEAASRRILETSQMQLEVKIDDNKEIKLSGSSGSSAPSSPVIKTETITVESSDSEDGDIENDGNDGNDGDDDEDELKVSEKTLMMEKLIKYATLDEVETIILSRWKIEKYLYLLAKACNETIEKAIARKIIDTL